jgi:hypothetical protein
MTRRPGARLPKSAERLLASLAAGAPALAAAARTRAAIGDAATLLAADLAARRDDGSLAVTAAGRAHLARAVLARSPADIEPFRGQHMALARHNIATPEGAAAVTVDEAESPLAWLARRRGRDGRTLIEPHQFQAGERLRGDFTRAQLMPRTTANWEAPVARERRSGGSALGFSDAVVAARQRVQHALEAVGPEFSGLLLDICCFLKGLADVERTRGWPARSGKVVLQLALDRLARHYGLSAQACGPRRGTVQTWLAPDAAFTSEIAGAED